MTVRELYELLKQVDPEQYDYPIEFNGFPFINIGTFHIRGLKRKGMKFELTRFV